LALSQVSLLGIRKIFPKKTDFVLSAQKNLFGLGQKIPGSEPDRTLMYCWSEVGLDRLRRLLILIELSIF